MSVGSFLSGLVSVVLGGGKIAAKAASTIGVTSVSVAGTKVSITAIIADLDMLSKIDFDAALNPVDFASAKTFLMSQQFPADVVDIADLLGFLGLAIPPLAVASNYVRYAAVAISGVQMAIRVGSALDLFADLLPDGHGGYVSQSWIDDPRHQLNADGTFKN